MTGFADLPNELIIEVWRHVVDPKSVENFALTNKTIYALGTKFIKEHNELKAKSSPTIIHDQNKIAIHCPAERLKTLLQNLRAALYIRNVSIYGYRGGGKGGCEGVNDNGRARYRFYFKSTLDLFRQFVKNSPLKLRDGNVSWLNSLEAEKNLPYAP